MKILLVESDLWQRATLTKVLEENRYEVDVAGDEKMGLALAKTVAYDLILLDVQMSQFDGISLCRQVRSQGYCHPILLLITPDSDADADAVAGFEAGADDYIMKPCLPEVLLARMRTLLRSSRAMVAKSLANDATTTLIWGELCLDPKAGRVTVGETVITLTATEYNLLELFLRHPDRIFSRSVILDRLWGFDDAPTDRAIVTHVKDLRKKLKAGGLNEDLIETVYGMGYRLKPAPSQANGLENFPRNRPLRFQGQAAIDRVLERFRDSFNEQAAVLEQAKNALLAGNLEADLQQAARQESHKLAGSLTSFGYPEGSKLARSLEHLLMEHQPFPSEMVTRFAELVAALQQALVKQPRGTAIAREMPSTGSPRSSVTTHRVLVIDDDLALTERLKAEAGAWGVRLSVVTNPAEARSHLRRNPPDMVLLDLSFPEAEEDGLTLLQEMTQQFPELPVIVFTGRDSLADRLAVFRSGARQFLHKAATPEQIFTAIARVVPKTQASEARVLIVDDDPGILALLSSMLTPWGLEVITLSNPQEFWNVLVATAPNMVLLDLEMPQISGLELCQVIRQDPQWEDIPLLVVTAHTDADSLQQAFAAGADDFITKPVLGPELVTRVISRIDRTRLYQK